MYCGGADRRRRLRALPRRAAAIRRHRHRASGAHGTVRCSQRAAFLIAPSRWAADMLARYFPDCAAEVIAHGAPACSGGRARRAARPSLLPDDGVPTVAVLGAIGPDKGARRLERLVALARERGACVRFVLIGYLDCPARAVAEPTTRCSPCTAATIPPTCRDLLAHYRVALVLYPSAGPETFSYTLSEAWAAGRPVLVPPIGALAERVRGSGAGWVMTRRRMARREEDAGTRARDTGNGQCARLPRRLRGGARHAASVAALDDRRDVRVL